MPEAAGSNSLYFKYVTHLKKKRKKTACAVRSERSYLQSAVDFNCLAFFQIKELEDALATAQQSSTQLQSQLDTASASAQLQASAMEAAETRSKELKTQLESRQSESAQAQQELSSAKDALQAKQDLMAAQEQQMLAKVHNSCCAAERPGC